MIMDDHPFHTPPTNAPRTTTTPIAVFDHGNAMERIAELERENADLRASLNTMIEQSRVDSKVAGIAICKEYAAISRAEKLRVALQQAHDFIERGLSKADLSPFIAEDREVAKEITAQLERMKAAIAAEQENEP